MVRFKIADEKELYKQFLNLNDMVRAGNYPKTMIGSYNDFALKKLGIVIDGKKEKQLAADFQEVLEVNDVAFERINQFGVLFFRDRTF